MNDIVKEITDRIKSKDGSTTLIYGTGLSINSGCLGVEDIKKAIMNALQQILVDFGKGKLLNDATINYVVKNTAQFEDFIMRLYDDLNIDTNDKEQFFKKMFKILYDYDYEPNNNHYFLAKLLKDGFANIIATTNFDVLLENAYKELTGIKFEKDITIHSFNKIISSNDTDLKSYYKLHGCITDSENIIATLLVKVSSKENISIIENSISNILNNSKNIIFMGYSFSDIFDIVKVLDKKLKNTDNYNIYIIAHNNCCKSCLNESVFTVYEWNELLKRNKIKCTMPTKKIGIINNTNVRILWCNTDSFVKEISKELNIAEYDIVIKKIDYYNRLAQNIKQLFNEFMKDKPEYIYQLAWRMNLECGQNYSIKKDDDKYKFDNNEKEIMEVSLKNALELCNEIEKIIEGKYIEKKEKEGKKNINKKHIVQTKIALGDYLSAKKELDKLIKCKQEDEFNIWLKYECIRRLFEINYQMAICKKKILCYYNTSLYDTQIDNIKKTNNYPFELIYHRIKVLNIATTIIKNGTKTNSEFSVVEINKIFTDAKQFFEKHGRMEYLSILYLEYARFQKVFKLSEEECEKNLIETIKIFGALGGENDIFKFIAENEKPFHE